MVEILLPSMRWDPWVRGLLRHLDWMSREYGILIAVSDNSQIAEKQQFISATAAGNARFRYLVQPRRISAFDNYDALLQTAASPRGVLVGDDDWVFPDYVLGADELLDTNPGVSAVMGCLLHLVPGVSTYLHPPTDITFENPADRVRQYLAQNDGYNLPVLSVFRTDALRPFQAFCRRHPFVVSFFDYFQTFSLLAAGRLVSRHAHGPYLYVNANWSTSGRVHESNTKSYTTLGLPNWFAEFHMLYRAVEGFNFFMGGCSPLADEQMRQAAGLAVVEHYIGQFRANLGAVDSSWWAGLQSLGIETHVRPFETPSPMRVADMIGHFLAILQRASPDLCRRYLDFHNQHVRTPNATHG